MQLVLNDQVDRAQFAADGLSLAGLASRPIVYLAIELSATSWVVACRRPMNEKIKLHRMEPGDGDALLALISELRRKAVAEGGVDVIIASCFEAGRDSPSANGGKSFPIRR